MNKKIDDIKRKELLKYMKKEYGILKNSMPDRLDMRTQIGLSGLFSLIFKLVKNGSSDDFEIILKLLIEAKKIIISGIIPDDMKKMIDKEKEKLPSNIKEEITEDIIKQTLQKINNPLIIKSIDEIISQFKNILE